MKQRKPKEKTINPEKIITNKKAAIELSFQFIFGLIIVVVILFVAFYGINLLLDLNQDSSNQKIIDDLNTLYSFVLSLNYNSEYTASLEFPTGNLCFYDPDAETQEELNVLSQFEAAVNNSYQNNRINVFMIRDDKLFPLIHMNLENAQKEICFNSTGKVQFTLISKGNSATIKNE